MKILVKGIESPEDAELCVRNGADGVIVSNHGGRATESGRATIDSLPEVIQAVRDRIPVLVDGGFRRGTDVFKALALGARAICIGRPYMWGVAAFGQPAWKPCWRFCAANSIWSWRSAANTRSPKSRRPRSSALVSSSYEVDSRPVLLLLFVVSCQRQAPSAQQPANPETVGLLEGIAAGKTEIVDLGHSLNSRNPYWPGPGYEPFKFEIFATIEKDHVLSGRMAFAEHTGTHLDAPNHFVAGQVVRRQDPAKATFCPGCGSRRSSASRRESRLSTLPADITGFEQSHGRIPDNAVVFMYTGWDQRWDNYDRYKNADDKKVLHFPGFSPDAVKLLVDERNIAGLGIDTLSVDYGMSTDFLVHHLSHSKGKVPPRKRRQSRKHSCRRSLRHRRSNQGRERDRRSRPHLCSGPKVTLAEKRHIICNHEGVC